MLEKSRKHLDGVNEDYFTHLCFASRFGARMVGAGVAAILHGLCPAIFQYTGSKMIFALNDILKERQAHSHHDHG